MVASTCHALARAARGRRRFGRARSALDALIFCRRGLGVGLAWRSCNLAAGPWLEDGSGEVGLSSFTLGLRHKLAPFQSHARDGSSEEGDDNMEQQKMMRENMLQCSCNCTSLHHIFTLHRSNTHGEYEVFSALIWRSIDESFQC